MPKSFRNSPSAASRELPDVDLSTPGAYVFVVTVDSNDHATIASVEFDPTDVLSRLDALEAAAMAGDMDLPGFDFHRLHGFSPDRYSVHVNGPWCLTFAFNGADAVQVDFEQYH